MNVQVLKNDLPAALTEGLSALRPFGIDLPAFPDDPTLDAQIEATMALMKDRSFDAIAEMPRFEDPELDALGEVLQEFFAPAYFLSTNNFGISVAKLLELTLRHGLSRHSIYALINFGMFLCARGEIETGYAFGRTALLVVKAHPDRKSEAMLENMWGAFVQHWKEGYPACHESLLKGIHAGLETGQYIWAFYCCVNANTNSFLRGLPLGDVLTESRSFQGLRRLDWFNAITWMVGAVAQICHNLSTPSDRPAELVGEWVDIHAVIRDARAIDSRAAQFFANCYRVLLCVFQGAFDEGARIALETNPDIVGIASWQGNPAYHFYAGIAFTQAAYGADPEHREIYLEKAEAYARKVARWAELCPENLAHRSVLLGAELTRARGDKAAAGERYDEAIRLAEEGAYVSDQALGNELAARHFLALGRTTIARGYLAEAVRLYDRWGATEVTRRLARELPDLVVAPSEVWGPPSSRAAHGAASVASSLDIASALKASQAIAGEIVLPRLLEQLLRIIVENAGARRGILILKREGKLLAFAEHRAGEAQPVDPGPLEDRTDLAVSVAHYVARTEEDVLLDERAVEGPFGADPYLARGLAKSTLVSPLVHKGRLTGVLYLENDLAARAFTPDRVELIRMLSAQVATSIENAELYAELERKVEERTLELLRANEEILALHSAEQARKDAEMQAQRVVIEHQEEVIHALLAPVLEVWDGVLAVPLVGALDDQRAAAITESLLARVVSGRCQFVILDLTGVEIVDAGTADMLVRIVRSLRLLGSKAIVTGIRPRVAQALLAAGAELGGILTRANLREGLQYCLGVRAPGVGRTLA